MCDILGQGDSCHGWLLTRLCRRQLEDEDEEEVDVCVGGEDIELVQASQLN